MYRKHHCYLFKSCCKRRYVLTMIQKPSQQKREWIHPDWLPLHHTGYSVLLHPYHYRHTMPKYTKSTNKKHVFPLNAKSAVWFIFPLNCCFNWPVFLRAGAITGFTPPPPQPSRWARNARLVLSLHHIPSSRALLMHQASRE